MSRDLGLVITKDI